MFDTVEVNSTFYRLASPKAVARWVEETPDDFLFAAKASRYLTHVRRLARRGGGHRPLLRAHRAARPIDQTGPIVWQLPPNFQRDDETLARVLALLPAGRHCFEFRHESWFDPDVYAILRQRHAALVIADHPKWPFQAHELTTDWSLVRLHHGHRGRRGNYSPAEVDEWARRIAGWRRRAEVFVYFNNDWEGFAVANAIRLKRQLRQSPDA